MSETSRIDFEKSRKALRDSLLRHMSKPGDYPTPVKGLVLHRYHNSEAPKPRFYEPVVIVVVQGKKKVRIGSEDIPYGENTCFITGVNMPVSSCILEASEESPYLSLSLNLDKSLLALLAAKISATQKCDGNTASGAIVQPVCPELLDAFLRLLELTQTPDPTMILSNLVIQEIYFRLLTSPFGAQLRNLNTLGSQSNQITQAVNWLQENYKESLRVEDLAGRLHMAPSTFHKHFKEITTLSPLQYQKQLRLTEAQRLMLAGSSDVTQAAFAVGYESPTQFNREYKRLFGESPRRNVLQMRGAVG